MKKFLSMLLIPAALVVFGCEPAEKAPEQKEKGSTKVEQEVKEQHAVVKEGEKIPVVAAEEPAVEAEPTPATTVDQVIAEAGASKTTAEAVSEAVQETTEEAMQTTSSVAEEAVQEIQPAAEKAAQAINTVEEKTTATAAATQPTISAQIVLQASYGEVTVPHQQHGEDYGCNTCHGEGTPGVLELTKDAAHDLCKGCHKAEGAGPTGCRNCHVK